MMLGQRVDARDKSMTRMVDARPKFRLYVDEVGNPDMDSSDDPNHRYLSLTGVAMALDHVRDIVHPEMEGMKQRFFGQHPDEPLILHRKEIVNAKSPFDRLSDPATRAAFDEALLDAFRRWEFTAFTVCLDKKRHRDTYTTWRFHPYHYCLTVLVERYSMFLERVGGIGDTMAESRGGKEDIKLKESFHRMWERGSDYMGPERLHAVLTSSQLKVKPKAVNVAGLQVADLLAHPSRNEILRENGVVIKLAPFAEKVISVLRAKYDRAGERVFGKKML